jgi:hypothetical protein
LRRRSSECLAGVAAGEGSGRAGSTLDLRHRCRRVPVDRLAEIAGSDVACGAGVGALDALATVGRRRGVRALGQSRSGHKHCDDPDDFGHDFLYDIAGRTDTDQICLAPDWPQNDREQKRKNALEQQQKT